MLLMQTAVVLLALHFRISGTLTINFVLTLFSLPLIVRLLLALFVFSQMNIHGDIFASFYTPLAHEGGRHDLALRRKYF